MAELLAELLVLSGQLLLLGKQNLDVLLLLRHHLDQEHGVLHLLRALLFRHLQSQRLAIRG